MVKWLIGLLLAVSTFSIQANIVITGTRVVYPSNHKSITVELVNQGERPSLVQAWLDNGDEKADPKTIKLPFIITPPVSRVDPKKQQMLRIAYTGEPLAQDRETLFFFNVLDIPPKPSKEILEKNPSYLQLAMRSRLKFFFRPSQLPYSVTQAYEKTEWTVKGNQISVHNPTPYFITYSFVQVKSQNQTVKAKNTEMVAPFSSRTFQLNKSVSGGQVEWGVINDYGGVTKGSSLLK